jgi:hypothetical protein
MGFPQPNGTHDAVACPDDPGGPLNQRLYVGDPWELEVTVTNTKTGAPLEPASLSALIYSPAARLPNATVPPVGPVTLPKLETNVYEAVVVAELNENGQWLAVITSPAPDKKVLPVVVSVAEPV